MESREPSRRDFVKKVAYVTPIVLTLKATPSSARNGSGDQRSAPTTPRPAQPVPSQE